MGAATLGYGETGVAGGSRANVGVSELVCEHDEVSAVLQVLPGEAVPPSVGVAAAGDAGLLGDALQQVREAGGGEVLAGVG